MAIVLSEREELMEPGILIQIGGRRRYIVAKALQEENLLRKMYTDLSISSKNNLLLSNLPVIGNKLATTFGNRVIPDKLVKSVDNAHIKFLNNRYFNGTKNLSSLERQLKIGSEIQSKVRNSDLSRNSFVYAYDKASAICLERAASSGIKGILDQTIAPCDMMEETLKSHSSLYSIPYSRYSKTDVELIMNEQERAWAACDVIVCGSEFVRSKLIEKKITKKIIPIRPIYQNYFGQAPKVKSFDSRKPLRLLTVGQLSLRKGTHIALKAAERLGSRVEWSFVGGVSSEMMSSVNKAPANVNIKGYLRGKELLNEFNQADVFVFPSIWEGSAYSLIEAAGLGLPCVATESSGTWIQDGQDGFIIKTADPDSIVNAIENFLDFPELVNDMSKSSILNTEINNWNSFKKNLIDAISE